MIMDIRIIVITAAERTDGVFQFFALLDTDRESEKQWLYVLCCLYVLTEIKLILDYEQKHDAIYTTQLFIVMTMQAKLPCLASGFITNFLLLHSFSSFVHFLSLSSRPTHTSSRKDKAMAGTASLSSARYSDPLFHKAREF
jgi:hypothetical protein